MSYDKFVEAVPHWDRISRSDYNYETGGEYGHYSKGRKGNAADYRRSGVHRPAVLAAFKALRKLGIIALAKVDPHSYSVKASIKESMAAKGAHSAVWITNEDRAWPSNIGTWNGKGSGETAGELRIEFIGVGVNDEGIMDVAAALVNALKAEKIDSHLVRDANGGGSVYVGPSTRLYEFTAEERVELAEKTTRRRLVELKAKLRDEENLALWAWERAEHERNTAYEVGSKKVYMEHSIGGVFTRMEIVEELTADRDKFTRVEDYMYIVRPVDGIGVSQVHRSRLLTESEAKTREEVERTGLSASRKAREAVYR